jgi:hypothetical protein
MSSLRAQTQTIVSRGGARAARLDGRAVPHRVILRALPSAISRRFDPSAAGDLRGVFELRIRDPRGGGPARFQITVSEGRCDIERGPASEPGATATVGADDLIRMTSGATGFPELLATGRLELGGDPFLALRFPALFRLPARRAGK